MKQLWRAILIFACAIVFGGIVTQTFATDSYQRGDVDGDGKITAAVEKLHIQQVGISISKVLITIQVLNIFKVLFNYLL